MGGFRVQGLGFWGLFMVSGSVFVWGSGCISGLGSWVFGSGMFGVSGV